MLILIVAHTMRSQWRIKANSLIDLRDRYTRYSIAMHKIECLRDRISYHIVTTHWKSYLRDRRTMTHDHDEGFIRHHVQQQTPKAHKNFKKTLGVRSKFWVYKLYMLLNLIWCSSLNETIKIQILGLLDPTPINATFNYCQKYQKALRTSKK